LEYNWGINAWMWMIGSAEKMRLDANGQLGLPITGSGAGILLGGDAQWYRDAANVLRTPDTIVFDAQLLKGITPVPGVDVSIKRNQVGTPLAQDDLIYYGEFVPTAEVDLNGFSVGIISAWAKYRPKGAGSLIAGEFAADVGAHAVAFTGDVRGIYGRCNVYEAAGAAVTIPNMYAVRGDIGLSSAGGGHTVTNAYSGYFADPDATNIGTITNKWAIYAGGRVQIIGNLEVDTIIESTGAAGVTTDGVLHKDNEVKADRFYPDLADTGFYLDYVAANRPGIFVDGNDWLEYTRGENAWKFYIGGAVKTKFDGNWGIADGGNILGYSDQYITQKMQLRMSDGLVKFSGALQHEGTTIGFFSTAPAVRAAAYTPTNVTPDRAYDADATTLDEIADVLGTLIADLQTYGLLQ